MGRKNNENYNKSDRDRKLKSKYKNKDMNTYNTKHVRKSLETTKNKSKHK